MSYPSLRGLTEKLECGDLTSRKLVESSISAYQSCAKALGAYSFWTPELAVATADAADLARKAGAKLGRLQGITCSVKDNFALEGVPLHAGARRSLPDRFNQEGPVVRALRKQLSPVVGKTHTDEFAYGGIGAVCHGELPRNPWDSASYRLAGGSSSGAGLSLLDGTANFALATDTSGSVRRPAAMTGTVGVKLTIGRWSTAGMVPLTRTLDTPGFLTRTVADAFEVFRNVDPNPDETVLKRAESSDGIEGLRLGICTDHFWDDCSPGIAENIQSGLRKLESQGATIVEIKFPEIARAYRVVQNGGIVAAEFSAFLESEIPEFLDLLHPLLSGRLRGTDRPQQLATAYLRNIVELENLAVSAEAHFRSIDVLVTPTVPITAPKVEEVDSLTDYERLNALGVRNTYIPSLLKLNAISMPVGMDDSGIPVGMQLIASGGSDERNLAVAYRIEKALGSGTEQFGIAPLVRN